MRVDSAKEIAEIIKGIAKQRNVSILQMCEDCGVSKNALSTMNAGSMPSISTVSKFADYLGVPVGKLLGDDEKVVPTLDEQLSDIDFALYGEVRDLTDEQKQAIINVAKMFKQ